MENSQTNRGDQKEGQKTPLNLVNTSEPERSKTDSKSGTAAATARGFYDQAKETAGQAYEAVTERAAEKLDGQRTSLSDGLNSVADSVRQVSSNLASGKTESGLTEAAAKYTDTAARKIEAAAGYFENKDVRQMARDLEGFARRNPALFVGAAFGLGILVARFFKSSTANRVGATGGKELKSAEQDNEQAFESTTLSGKGDKPTSEFNARPM